MHAGKVVVMVKIEDTYSEAFDGLVVRLLVTAERASLKKDRVGPDIWKDPLRFLAYRATSTPATVVGRTEGGIEKWVPGSETPDGRDGVILQFWGQYDPNPPPENPFKEQLKKFYRELSIRIRQDILSVSGGTAEIFDCFPEANAKSELDLEYRVGRCGGGYEEFLTEHGNERVKVQLMMGYDFKTDRFVGYDIGVSGGNLWIFCDNWKTGQKAGNRAVDAILKSGKVVTPFYVCPSGSMVGKYDPIGPPTNYQYCPSLRNKIPDSKVPEGVNSIPEIVINGLNIGEVEHAMRNAIYAVAPIKGVLGVSAGNYEGKLGQHKIFLRNLVQELF
jgi:formylmethanofuran--tetrahydromethanopterin N-formyltransferase